MGCRSDDRKLRVKRFLRSAECPLILYGVIMLVLYSCISTSMYDDGIFSQVLRGDQENFGGWIDYLKLRWNTWSSRLAIEGVMIFLARFPIVWRIASVPIHLAVFYMFSDLAGGTKSAKKNWIIFFMMFIFPVPILYETGAIATTLNGAKT